MSHQLVRHIYLIECLFYNDLCNCGFAQVFINSAYQLLLAQVQFLFQWGHICIYGKRCVEQLQFAGIFGNGFAGYLLPLLAYA